MKNWAQGPAKVGAFEELGAAALVTREALSGKITCGQRALTEARRSARWRSRERAFPREKEPVQRPWG